MEDSKGLVLVYSGMPPVNREDRFSIVITPQNYLLKREYLAIKQEYQSRKIASSIFDEIIEDDKDEYSFFVYKDDDAWIFIAYKQKEIMKLLSEVGISPNNVDEIFFAQQLAPFITKPISFEDDNALISLNGIATVVPKNILPEDTEYENISSEMQPKKAAMQLSSTMVLIDSKYILLISIVFIIFGLLFLIESRNSIQINKENQNKVYDILKHNPSLSSKYTRESVLSKYTNIDNIERTKRDLIAKLSKIIDKGVKINSFNLHKNTYSLSLVLTNKSILNNIKRKAKLNGFRVELLGNDEILIKGKL